MLDHTQDIAGRETHRLLSLYPAPDFVKTADHDRLHGNPETLARHLYAEPHKKLYPCHTAPATWMSALWFAEKRAEFDAATATSIETRIKTAADYFGIAGLLEQLTEKVAADRTNDLAKLSDSAFAIVWKDENGAVERHWPMRNATEVKFACAHFKKHRDEFVFPDRCKIANKILDKALEFAADTSPAEGVLETTAGRGLCATKVAAELVRGRAQLTKRSHAALSSELEKLAQLIESSPAETQNEECRLKLAAIIDQFDRETKLFRLYDEHGLARPEDVLFAITEKVARDFMSQNVETTTGNVYALDDLEKLAVEDIRAWLGDDLADAVSSGGVYTDRDKLAAIVPTLDRGMAATLDRLMTEKSAAPVATNAAEGMMSADRLYELAAQADNK
jgi:predicted O-methyltransferase YrrM